MIMLLCTQWNEETLVKKESKDVTARSHVRGRRPLSLDVLLRNKRGFAAALARMIHARRSRYPDISVSDYLTKITGWSAEHAFRMYISSTAPSRLVISSSLEKEFPELRNYYEAMGLHTLGTTEVIVERITELPPKTEITMFSSSTRSCPPGSFDRFGELDDILACAIVNNQCRLRIVAPNKMLGGLIKAGISWKVEELSVAIQKSVRNKISMRIFDEKSINIPHTLAFFFKLFREEKESSGLLYIEGINPLIAPPSFPMCGWIYLTEIQLDWYRNALKMLK